MGTLALVIGMNAAIFSVMHAALFRPIPYPHSDRLIWLGNFSERERRDIHVGRGAYMHWEHRRHGGAASNDCRSDRDCYRRGRLAGSRLGDRRPAL
jgi:hypothetical protein